MASLGETLRGLVLELEFEQGVRLTVRQVS
jgi:hypothetical protein